MPPAILFFKEDTQFRLPGASRLPAWIASVVRSHGRRTGDIHFIFCSDAYLRRMNIRYLSHHTYTDILTFDTSTDRGQIDGDIFISEARVRSNALEYGTTFRDEMHRVMIHGVLHLLGFDDVTAAGKQRMRGQEEASLARRKFLRTKRGSR